MTTEQYLNNLNVPEKAVDVVLDTDAFNEIDDQFAIAYLLASEDKLKLKAIYAAPFLNQLVETAQEGMEKSYEEILRLLELMDRNEYQADWIQYHPVQFPFSHNHVMKFSAQLQSTHRS